MSSPIRIGDSMQDFVVKYDRKRQRVERVISENALEAFQAYWENADHMYRIQSGPCSAVAFWFDTDAYILVKAEDAETAAKIAPDVLEQ